MELHELIIKSHARAHAAELAVHAKCQDVAWNELTLLLKLLNDQPELEGSKKQTARRIERYATEAIEGLRTQGATADTEHRLTDIRSLAHSIE